MMRATAWTGGLFALGSVICHIFRAPWVEPMVLLALGITLLLVSGRGEVPASAGKATHAAAAEPLDPAGDRAAR